MQKKPNHRGIQGHDDGVQVCQAVKAGDVESVQRLLDQGVDPNTADLHSRMRVLHLAASKNDFDMVRLLLEKGADPSMIEAPGGQALISGTATHAAVRHPQMLKLLLDRGAPLNLRNGDGHTPLHSACDNDQMASVKVLLDAGANHRLRSRGNETAREMAHQNGYDDIVAVMDAFIMARKAHQAVTSSRNFSKVKPL